MAKHRDSMPGQEKEEKQDVTEEQSDKRMLVDITSEKTDDKAPAGMIDPSADYKLSDKELGNVGSTDAKETTEKSQSPGHLECLECFESLSCEDENVEGKSEGPVSESAELAQIRSPSTKARLASHQAFLESLKADKKADHAGPSEMHKQKPWTKEEMLSYLNDHPHALMEAVCALHRLAVVNVLMRIDWPPASIYDKLRIIAEFLMDEDVYGRCRRTPAQLEQVYGGALTYCSWLVSTYSDHLHDYYMRGMDDYFSPKFLP